MNLAITREVLDRVVRVALRESGARRLGLKYLPGGYLKFDVVPSAQLDARATAMQTRDALAVVGYLAQQSLVIASRRTGGGGDTPALEITQSGGRDLTAHAFAQKFWRRLSELEPKLNPGFAGTASAGRPGLYLIDREGDWPPPGRAAELDAAVAAVSKGLRVSTRVTHFRVEYVGLGNDWVRHARGEEYLRRLAGQGRGGLARRLERVYAPRVERWIAAAFRRHAPGALPPAARATRPRKLSSHRPPARRIELSAARVSGGRPR